MSESILLLAEAILLLPEAAEPGLRKSLPRPLPRLSYRLSHAAGCVQHLRLPRTDQ